MSLDTFPTNWYYIVLVSLILVGIGNHTPTNTLTETLTETILNFDASLSNSVDQFIMDKQTGMTQGQYLMALLTIIAHLMIFVFVFMFSYHVLAGESVMSSLFYTAIIVTIFHALYLILFNSQPTSLATLMDALPFTGILHLFKELFTNTAIFKMDGLIDKARENVVETTMNITNDKFNMYDFDMS